MIRRISCCTLSGSCGGLCVARIWRRLLQRPLVHVQPAAALPVVPAAPVDDARLGHLLHVQEGVLVAQEIPARAHLPDQVHGQRVVVHPDPPHHVLDHAREIVVHHQLAEVEGYSHLQHPQTVDHVGSCQRRYQGREGLLMARLGIRQLGIPLPTGHEAGQRVAVRQLGHRRADQGQLR